MRAVRTAGKKVQVVEVPNPTEEGVRVRVRAAGICGSDLSMLDVGFMQSTIGHEFAGVLDDGRAVAIQPITPCEDCEFCNQGEYPLCSTCMSTTQGVYRDGGMCDEVRVHPACLVPLPKALNVQDASLVEPLAVGIHGLARAEVTSGQRVAVVGAGTVGLLAGAAALARGCEVDIVGRHPAQLRAAEQLELGREPNGVYDLVIDAAGSEAALRRCVELARPGGGLLLLAWDWERIPLPGIAVAAKELVIRPTLTYGHSHAGRDVDVAAALLAQQPTIAEALITHRFPLDDAAYAFEIARDRKAGAIKVVLEP